MRQCERGESAAKHGSVYAIRDGALSPCSDSTVAILVVDLPLLRLARHVDAALRTEFSEQQRIQIVYREHARSGWVSLAHPAILFRGHRESLFHGQLVSEFEPGACFEIIAEYRSQLLLRGRCGTAGWCEARDVRVSAAPSPWSAATAREADLHRFATTSATELKRWLGTPYALGGSSSNGIDCSALTHRVVSAMLGATIPRHSSDQLAISAIDRDHSSPIPASTEPLLLTFLWTDQEAPCHVTLQHADWPDMSIHASRSRNRVVIDNTASLESKAHMIRRVTMPSLLAYRAKLGGLTSVPETLLAQHDSGSLQA